jgi:hypothetical protein
VPFDRDGDGNGPGPRGGGAQPPDGAAGPGQATTGGS